MWLLHLEFRIILQHGGKSVRKYFTSCGWEGHKVLRKLKFVKSKFKIWNKDTFGDLRERKSDIILGMKNLFF